MGVYIAIVTCCLGAPLVGKYKNNVRLRTCLFLLLILAVGMNECLHKTPAAAAPAMNVRREIPLQFFMIRLPKLFCRRI